MWQSGSLSNGEIMMDTTVCLHTATMCMCVLLHGQTWTRTQKHRIIDRAGSILEHFFTYFAFFGTLHSAKPQKCHRHSCIHHADFASCVIRRKKPILLAAPTGFFGAMLLFATFPCLHNKQSIFNLFLLFVNL